MVCEWYLSKTIRKRKWSGVCFSFSKTVAEAEPEDRAFSFWALGCPQWPATFSGQLYFPLICGFQAPSLLGHQRAIRRRCVQTLEALSSPLLMHISMQSHFCFAVVVQLLSRVRLFVTPWTPAHQASLSFTISQSLLKLMSTEPMMPSNHLILRHPLLLLSAVFPSIRVFSNELTLRIRWPKYWNFSFSISSSNEYSGLISFRMDWLDLLAIQGTLKSLL